MLLNLPVNALIAMRNEGRKIQPAIAKTEFQTELTMFQFPKKKERRNEHPAVY